jgi:hypothetical protein
MISPTAQDKTYSIAMCSALTSFEATKIALQPRELPSQKHRCWQDQPSDGNMSQVPEATVSTKPYWDACYFTKQKKKYWAQEHRTWDRMVRCPTVAVGRLCFGCCYSHAPARAISQFGSHVYRNKTRGYMELNTAVDNIWCEWKTLNSWIHDW